MKKHLFAFLKPMAIRLTQPVMTEVRHQIHRLLVAVSLAATGVACVIAGLAYFASSFWHALVPGLGTVGADLVLGTCYTLGAATLLLTALRMVR